jgi:hypothetical protein
MPQQGGSGSVTKHASAQLSPAVAALLLRQQTKILQALWEHILIYQAFTWGHWLKG